MIRGYKLSERADEDFESIYVYGLVNFGLFQADTYADGLEARFEQIALQPKLFPAIDHVKAGYRLCVYKSHAIYFRSDGKCATIVRILRNQHVGAALE